MQGLLIVLLVVAALTCVLVAAMARALHSSDQAGNGLAQAYFVFGLALQWLLVVAVVVLASVRAPHDQVPTLTSGALHLAVVLLISLAKVAQLSALPWLFDGRNQGAWRVVIRAALVGVPLAFLCFAAWRGAGLPLPTWLALFGCGAVVVVGSFLPLAAQAAARRRQAPSATITVFHVLYPALLLRVGDSVRVLRHADELSALLADTALAPEALVLVDANCATYTWPDSRGPGAGLVRNPTPITFEALVAELLRIEHLHVDPTRDAEIRRLVGMQRNVSALSFVLDR
jgi:hypothetical protein